MLCSEVKTYMMKQRLMKGGKDLYDDVMWSNKVLCGG